MSTTYTARRIVWSSKSLIPMALAMIAAGFDFYVPVSAFFLESRGLSLTDIFMLESVLVASILVAEIPAGVIGDRFDRRRLVGAGLCSTRLPRFFLPLAQISPFMLFHL